MLEEYLLIQDKVADKDHKIVKDAFLAADVALDTWEGMLGESRYDYLADMRVWVKAKGVILKIIRIYGGA